jgi:hypothetical protein
VTSLIKFKPEFHANPGKTHYTPRQARAFRKEPHVRHLHVAAEPRDQCVLAMLPAARTQVEAIRRASACGDHVGNFAWEDALPCVIGSNPRVASRTARPRWYRAMALRVARESVAPLSICRFKVRIIAL